MRVESRRFRISSYPTIGVSFLMFVGIFLLRLAVRDPVEPVLFLMVVPISLIGVEFGLVGGALAAGLASVLVIVWELVNAPDLSALGYSTRFLVFFLSGLTVGALTSSRREKEAESERWFEGSADLNCVADFQGKFIRVNRAWTTALGYSSQELTDVPYASFIHPDDIDNTTQLSTKLTDGRAEVIDFENRYRTVDGRYRWLRWTATVDEARRLIYASARDVTTTKELELQLRELAQTDPLNGSVQSAALRPRGNPPDRFHPPVRARRFALLVRYRRFQGGERHIWSSGRGRDPQESGDDRQESHPVHRCLRTDRWGRVRHPVSRRAPARGGTTRVRVDRDHQRAVPRGNSTARPMHRQHRHRDLRTVGDLDRRGVAGGGGYGDVRGQESGGDGYAHGRPAAQSPAGAG